jgi:hypothetical protein
MVVLTEVFNVVNYFTSFPELLIDVAMWMTSRCCVTLQGFFMLPLNPSTNLITEILGILLSFLFIVKGALGVLALSKITK